MSLDRLFQSWDEQSAGNRLSLLGEGILSNIFYINIAIKFVKELLEARCLRISSDGEFESCSRLKVVQFVSTRGVRVEIIRPLPHKREQEGQSRSWESKNEKLVNLFGKMFTSHFEGLDESHVHWRGSFIDERLYGNEKTIHQALLLLDGVLGSRLAIPRLIIDAFTLLRPDIEIIDHVSRTLADQW